jgi:hypothetical protein
MEWLEAWQKAEDEGLCVFFWRSLATFPNYVEGSDCRNSSILMEKIP